MFFLLRLIFWTAAMLFAAAPLALEVVASPERLGKLFQANSYIPFGRDLIFLAITILAIGLIDALEATLLLHGRRTTLGRKFIFVFTCLCLIGIFLQLCMFSYWSAHVEPQATADFIAASLYLVLIAASTALFARVILISSPAG
jgi:hypothetical protein